MTDSASPDQLSDDAAFSSRLKSAREDRGFTQGAVASRSKQADPEGRGVSRTAIIAYEQGTSRPGIRELRLICEVLHVTPNWLIYGTDSAGTATLPSLEFLSKTPAMRDVLILALAILSLKGHERDGLLTLTLSLAGRQLGDQRLSSLLAWSYFLTDSFIETIKKAVPDLPEGLSLEQVAEWMADRGVMTNQGNRFRLNEDGDVVNPEDFTYPGDPPKGDKSET